MKNQPLKLEFSSQKPVNETTYVISYGVKLELVCSNSTSLGSTIDFRENSVLQSMHRPILSKPYFQIEFVEPCPSVDNNEQTSGYFIETDEYYSKLSQNGAEFQSNILPNLADSCLFQKNMLNDEWLFETPSPYPNNFSCRRAVSCPNKDFIHYRFNRLHIGSPDEQLVEDLPGKLYKGSWLPFMTHSDWVILYESSCMSPTVWLIKYGGYGEMAQKVIEGVQWHVTGYAFEIDMAQNSNH